ncbi:MAG: hypothetical protein ACJ79J_09140, partial [Gemmatimonadaceae bacterium]
MNLIRFGEYGRFAERVFRRVKSAEARKALAEKEEIVRAEPGAERFPGKLSRIGIERKLVSIKAREFHEVKRRQPPHELPLSRVGEDQMRIAGGIVPPEPGKHYPNIFEHLITLGRVVG